MSWKCVCAEVNEDERAGCQNCGRKRPKYAGIKLDIEHDGDLTSEQVGGWYLLVALSFLRKAEDDLTYYKELQEHRKKTHTDISKQEERLRKVHKQVIDSCKLVFSLVDKAKLYGGAYLQIEDQRESRVFSINSMNGSCYYTLGTLEYSGKKYDKAIDYFQKSYDIDPSQSAIFNIALSTMYLPAEGGGLFGGGKKKIAKEEKQQQEMTLLMKSVQYAPFSYLGIRAARLLVEKYKKVMQPEEIRPPSE